MGASASTWGPVWVSSAVTRTPSLVLLLHPTVNGIRDKF